MDIDVGRSVGFGGFIQLPKAELRDRRRSLVRMSLALDTGRCGVAEADDRACVRGASAVQGRTQRSAAAHRPELTERTLSSAPLPPTLLYTSLAEANTIHVSSGHSPLPGQIHE
jgi:hypothetical protein